MNINRQTDYIVGDFSYKNFVNLTREQQEMVLRWRNNPAIRQWMFTREEISLADHLNFIKGLEKREDCYYWLIYYKGTPVGVYNVMHCHPDTNEGEPGYYIAEEYQGTGIGLDLQRANGRLFFDVLDFGRLVAHVQYGNTNAYLMAKFCGTQEDGIVEIDGVKYVAMHLDKDERRVVPEKHFARDFIKYCKTNPVEW